MQWLKELEGLRGLASIWVFAMHVSILCGASIPVISQGALGVDLFILLSGFLMVHNYEQRRQTQPWSDTKTIFRFWLRRFFRIAPLYYFLLIVSFGLGSILFSARQTIASYFPFSESDPARYTDHSLANLLTHISFAFGFLPHFSFHTALPDWSIGLEMQFYLVFPLLMLVVLRFGYIAMVCSTVILNLIAHTFATHFFSSFPMPSFLPLKIHMFLLGMVIAAAYHQKLRAPVVFAALLPLYALRVKSQSSPGWIACDICLAIGLLLVVMDYSRLRSGVQYVRRLLNLRICQLLGDISYSLYLVHLLIVIPVSAALLRIPGIATMPGALRFMLFLAVNAAIILPTSFLLYHVIEKPGITAGKAVLKRIEGMREIRGIDAGTQRDLTEGSLPTNIETKADAEVTALPTE